MLLYVLDGHTPVPCDDVNEWGEWFQDAAGRRVAETADGEITISTVFTGTDTHLDGKMFETMVFDGVLNETQVRCATWEEAEEQHREMVRQVTRAESGVEA